MSIESAPVNKCGHSRYEDPCEGIILTPELLALPIVERKMVYRRHPNGGGLVANDSYVPDDLSIPFDFKVMPNTRLLSSDSISGISYTSGNYTNGGPVSREMTEQDTEDLLIQKKERELPTLEEDEEYTLKLLAMNGLRIAID
jgi:hypothetical protein